MNAPFPPFPPFPTNPSVGQIFGSWVWNGAQWVPTTSNALQITIQAFTTPGTFTYTPAPGLITAIVECIGGGGAGGWLRIDTAGNYGAAGGGACGGYSRKVLAAALVQGGVIVTVGAGGTMPVGAPGGGQAGSTSFGALCVAPGGGNGWPFDLLAVLGPTARGDAGRGYGGGIGDVVFDGSAGHYWTSLQMPPSGPTYAQAGDGATLFGGASGTAIVGIGASTDGLAASNGGGGSGAQSNGEALATTRAGGPGGNGMCFVTEYASGDGGFGGCGQAPIPITDGSCLGWGGPC